MTLPEIGLLDPKHHDRSHFDCGEASLNTWLKHYAGQAERQDGAKTYVACEAQRVIGYYSLCSFQVESTAVPKRPWGGRYPVPAILLARLAVDESRQGVGIGEHLLLDALRISALVADKIGARLMVVHALHERAANFYLRNGFTRSETESLTLYLPMQDIRATLESVGLR